MLSEDPGQQRRTGGGGPRATFKARYTANTKKPPKGYRPKRITQPDHGYYDINADVLEARRRAAAEHRDRIAWIHRTRTELTKTKPQAAQMRPLLEQALDIIERRKDQS